MTTAARPTFEPARGGTGRGEGDLSALSKQYSSRDLPGHTKLKYRQLGQETREEVAGRDLKRDLLDKERNSKRHRTGGDTRRKALPEISKETLDQDEPFDSSSEESSDDEDDTKTLLAELAKIKKERAIEHQKKEVERAAEEERIRKETILSGNPLLNNPGNSAAPGNPSTTAAAADFSVKRRWDDDVVFKNCAKGVDEDKSDRFINDTIRSEFHKKFLTKYIK